MQTLSFGQSLCECQTTDSRALLVYKTLSVLHAADQAIRACHAWRKVKASPRIQGSDCLC